MAGHYHTHFIDTRKCGECRDLTVEQWAESRIAAWEARCHVADAVAECATRERDSERTLNRLDRLDLEEARAERDTLRARVATLEAENDALRAALEDLTPVSDDPCWTLRDTTPIHKPLGLLRAARRTLDTAR